MNPVFRYIYNIYTYTTNNIITTIKASLPSYNLYEPFENVSSYYYSHCTPAHIWDKWHDQYAQTYDEARCPASETVSRIPHSL